MPSVELSLQRYRELMEQSRGLICTHDLAGVLLSVSRAAAERLGYTPEELVGRSLGELLAPDLRPQFSEYLLRIRRSATDEGLMRVVTRDGDERVWSYSTVRGQEPAGSEFVLAHAHDVTDLKGAAPAGDAEALRSVSQLALATAHEINNPLTVIIASLQLMTTRGQVPDAAVGYVQRAIKSAEQIRDVVRDMSRLTRLELARQGTSPASVLDLTRSGAPRD